MKYRIKESGGLFFPQFKSWYGEWCYYFDSYCGHEIYASFGKLEWAKSFIDSIENGSRDRLGRIVKKQPTETIHRYP